MSSALPALVVAVPLLTAAVLAGTQWLGRRLLAEAVAVAAAIATTVLGALVLRLTAAHGELVYWFGGWHPHHGVALGIDFAVDPFGAGLACFSGVLTIAALIFSWRHFESVGHVFPALMLVFLAALSGFCLSGDLFDMFVFFELMTVVGIALTAYRADERAPLQGALNFGVSNAVGGFLVLFGIALLYGRTGALNLAQIGVALSRHHPDGLVIVALGLIICGFFVKAAIVPFHFWLADAYASAPTPVCIVYAGVMSEMGLYGASRVYWTVFSGAESPHTAALRLIFVITGSLTALGGAVMCLLQHLPKRLLAFATISSMGLFLIGFGLLDARGLAGTAIYVVSDGLVKASLFVCVGILQHRRAGNAPLRVRGVGQGRVFTGIVFGLSALGLGAMPGWGTFLGRSLIESAAADHPGYGWVPIVITVTEILIAAAVLAAAARAFLGWGPELSQVMDDVGEESDELELKPGRTPAVLFVPAVLLMAGGLIVGIVPGVARLALAGAARFEDRAGQAAAALHGHVAAVPAFPAPAPDASEILYGLLFSAIAAVLGLAVLAPRRWPQSLGVARRGWEQVALRLRELHGGHPGDDVTWLVVGAAVLCGALSLALR